MKNTKVQNRGIYESFAAILPYSLIPLIFLIKFNSPDDLSHSFAKGAVLTLGKDFLSSFAFMAIIVYQRKFKETMGLAKTRAGFYVMISSLFGGPLGYTFYNTAFYLAGPSFGHVFTSLEPILLALFAFFYLKRKFKWQMWLGVGLTVIATIALVAGESFVFENPEKIIIGSLLGVLGSIAWTLEAIFMDRAVSLYQRDNPEKDGINSLLTWKMLFAFLINSMLLFPIAGSFTGDVGICYKYFSEFFTNTNYLWRFLLVGFLIIMGRYLFFSSMRHLGATYSTVIYGLTVILIPILNLMYYGITGHYVGDSGESQLSSQFQIVFWTITPLIVLGASLATIYKPKFDRIKELE